jgi:hypothetical protein
LYDNHEGAIVKQTVIQARISKETLKELEFLKVDLGLEKTTAVVELALHHLALERKKRASRKTPFEHFEALGLIGGVELDADASTTYKKAIKKELNKKHRSSKGRPNGKK